MPNLSQNAQLLLYEIKDRLKQNNNNSFRFVQSSQSIVIGPLIGPDNTIPPSHVIRGQELQRLRQETALALNELVCKNLVLIHEQTEEHQTYVLNTNTLD